MFSKERVGKIKSAAKLLVAIGIAVFVTGCHPIKESIEPVQQTVHGKPDVVTNPAVVLHIDMGSYVDMIPVYSINPMLMRLFYERAHLWWEDGEELQPPICGHCHQMLQVIKTDTGFRWLCHRCTVIGSASTTSK